MGLCIYEISFLTMHKFVHSQKQECIYTVEILSIDCSSFPFVQCKPPIFRSFSEPCHVKSFIVTIISGDWNLVTKGYRICWAYPLFWFSRQTSEVFVEGTLQFQDLETIPSFVNLTKFKERPQCRFSPVHQVLKIAGAFSVSDHNLTSAEGSSGIYLSQDQKLWHGFSASYIILRAFISWISSLLDLRKVFCLL